MNRPTHHVVWSAALGSFAVCSACASSPPRATPSTVKRAPIAVLSADAGSFVPILVPIVPPSRKAFQKHDAAYAACAHDKASDADLLSRAKACAAATKMHQMGEPLLGKQADNEPPQKFSLKAEANKCYRLYAEAQGGIKDLDVMIMDSNGNVVAGDGASALSPVVGEDSVVCFKESDNASIMVSVGQGSGTWALQIWSD